MNRLKQYIRQIIDGQGMILCVSIIIVSILAVAGSSVALTFVYREAAAVREQIENMNQYIASYNELAGKINNAPFNIISADQLDHVQSQIILQVQQHNLQLIKLNILSKNNKNNVDVHDKTYEITILGSWSDTFHFIDQLGANGTLISERYASMKPDKNGMIETVMEYKVYTK